MNIFGICFHDYSNWSKLEISKEGQPFQIRRCLDCGKIEIRWL